LILCSRTGVGKSWPALTLRRKACRDNRSIVSQRIPKLSPTSRLARGDGRYARIQRSPGGVQLLTLPGRPSESATPAKTVLSQMPLPVLAGQQD
jgi:hypothetical protein